MTYSKTEQPPASPTDLPANVRATIFREARAAKAYSIEDLAVACGLTAHEITRIENGGDVDATQLRRVAHALGLPLSWSAG
jgi:transcriptional regulator with XRE-family HTH domain